MVPHSLIVMSKAFRIPAMSVLYCRVIGEINWRTHVS